MPSISFLLAATSGVSYVNVVNMATHFPRTNATGSRPSIPSVEEAIGRYRDLPSRPYFIARSSLDAWHIPSDLMIEINSDHRELRPVGKHPLCGIWNGKIDEEMHNYLVEQKVHYTSLDLVRLGVLDEATRTTPPVIVWVGVEPNTLSAQRGIEVAVSLRSVLLQHDINDVHVATSKYGHPQSPYMRRCTGLPRPMTPPPKFESPSPLLLESPYVPKTPPTFEGRLLFSSRFPPSLADSSSLHLGMFFSVRMSTSITHTMGLDYAGTFC